MYTNAVAKLKDPVVSRLSAFLSSSYHNSVNFCLIFRNYISKSKLRLLLSNETYIGNIFNFKVEQGLCKVGYSFWDTLYQKSKAYLRPNYQQLVLPSHQER